MGLGLAAALIALPAAAQTGTAAPGFIYFHREGATVALHEGDMRFCDGEARKMIGVDNGTPYDRGLLPGVIQLRYDSHQIQANIETCMLVRGWSAVRPPLAEEARLKDAPQATLVKYLGDSFGSPAPQGQVVRRYLPGAPTTHAMPGLDLAAQDSLSYRAVFGNPKTGAPLSKARPWPKEWTLLNRVKTVAALRPDATLLVVRTYGVRPGQQFSLRFMRIEERAAGGPALQVFQASSPTKMFWKAGTPMQDLYVFEVPPGRWLLLGDTISTFCLRAPGFEVKAGEAVFAGTFSSEIVGDLQPRMDPDPAKSALPSAIAGRLRPAEWRNGYRFDCGSPPATLLDAFEIKGAPSD
ncbi:MAG: hypothetical protein Q7T61_06535 [Caulobacter sp.]|nr:hypothetical protein [Caulobacter sp.]